MAKQVLKEVEPMKIKACGRKVQHFVDHEWTAKCRGFVKTGNIAKVGYSQGCFVMFHNAERVVKLIWNRIADQHPYKKDIATTLYNLKFLISWMLWHSRRKNQLVNCVACLIKHLEMQVNRKIMTCEVLLILCHNLCDEAVFNYCLPQFSQNEHLKKALFDTAGSTLVEASPRDRRWGIGLGKDNEKALSRDTWRGTNWLGQVLTEVREELMRKEQSSSSAASSSSGAAASLK